MHVIMDAFGFKSYRIKSEIYENSENQFVTSLRNIRFDQMDDQWNDSGLFIYLKCLIFNY